MKFKYLASAAFCIAAATGFMACGDDVITVYGDEVYSIVDDINDSACTSANDGKMSLEKKSGTLFLCEDGKWTPVNGSEVVDLRCKSSMLKDSIGYNIICDGDTIATIYNGQNGTSSNGSNGLDNYQLAHQAGLIDSTKVTREQWLKSLQGKDADAFLKELLGNKQIPDTVTTIDKLLEYLKGEKGSDGSNGSAGSNGLDSYQLAHQAGLIDSTKVTREQWLKSLQGKDANSDAIEKNLADKLACKVVNTVTDQEKGFMHVTVQCGDDEANQSTLDLPIYKVDDNLLENLAKHYKKHVVVRLPVMSEKLTDSDIYEEIWSRLKSDNHTELMVMDLDEKLNATGKMFMSDLFADVTKKGAFVTVEETNERVVKYKVVRLEGDIDLTNLENSLVQLRIKMNLTNTNGGFTFGGNGSSSTEVIYNAITDLSDGSDTVVIDFLTDYKVERVKKLVRKGEVPFADAVAQANAELAKALALVKDEKVLTLPAFEHYLPGSEGIGLNEYFNGIVWVMALIDQRNKVPDFNKIYNEYREVFAENGDFNKAIETTYNGIEQSLFFVDYLALLINANFYKWNCQQESSWGANCETESYTGGELDIYYKIIQNGLVSAYKLDTAKAVEVDRYSKVQKSEVEGGYFRYFEYYRSEKVWYPIIDLEQIAFAEAGKCDATAANAKIFAVFTVDNADYSMECRCEGDKCEYGKVDPCQGREEGHEGLAYFGYNTDASAYKCRTVCRDDDGNLTDDRSGTCNVESYDPSGPSLEDVVPNGKTIEELINEGRLGTCDATVANDPDKYLVQFDYDDAMISTRTRHDYYMCQCSGDDCKWIEADWTVLEFGLCSETVMKTQTEFKESSGNKYKCDYLDYEKVYGWTLAQLVEIDVKVICHYGISERTHNNEDGAPVVDAKGTFSADSLYVCAENGELYRNHTHDWRESTVDDKLGACNETVMANTSSNWKEFNSQKYKCDCMETAGTASTAPECEWTPGSETEVALNKPCTGNLVSGETPTLQNDAQGVPQVCSTVYDESQKPKHDWTAATPEQAFGVCDADKMAAQTKLSKLGSDYYKCDCEGEPSRSTAIMYSGCAWIQATELEVVLDAAKNAPCTAKLVHEEDGWTFSKNNLYYCGQKGIENTNDHEHNWLNMTSDLWCSVKSKPLADHENCTDSYEACSICNDIPEGVEGSGTTFIHRSYSGVSETVTADAFFGVDCSQEPKFIGNLESYEYGWYNFSENKYKYTVDNSLVHDFICKNGHVAEAADANEACNATFEKTEICTYMNEQYEHNGSGWVKMNCSTLHNENGRETKGRLCTMADGSEHYREWDYEDSYQVGIGSSSSTMYYKDKWYDVSDYCATKGDHCYKEGQEPTDMTSSIDCEFVRPYMEKEVFYCDQTDGVWKKDP